MGLQKWPWNDLTAISKNWNGLRFYRWDKERQPTNDCMQMGGDGLQKSEQLTLKVQQLGPPKIGPQMGLWLPLEIDLEMVLT